MAESVERVRCFIGLGSNLGDREAYLRQALELLNRPPEVEVLRVSALRETEPVGGPRQGPFLNGVAELQTGFSPGALLIVLRWVETQLGRVRELPNGPRTVDLDLLFYGEERIVLPGLEVPHPRMAERPFVMEPLRELLPEADELLERLESCV
ncbi:MAG: 2-amino-4-hydroxy-6-hydroxymethyldihydropteridine diphosphokinase [Candidatus Omnitrophica bacterium]|nr:2-amino-4-hydroxy-6-hydroxymethyldihydropteridine diphosphokinase [Candidatus Omnitrophota bacterium]